MTRRWFRLGSLALLMISLGLITTTSRPIAQENNDPEAPILMVSITPEAPYLQEEIVQVIQVIAPQPLEGMVLDLPPIEDADIIILQEPATRKVETEEGVRYRFETSRAIFPKRSGDLRLPPVRISGRTGVSGEKKKPFALRRGETVLMVRPPPPVFGGQGWLVAKDVRIEEAWSKPPDSFRVGDRVKRSITVTVKGATGAHLPDLQQGHVDGLTVLSGQTERNTALTFEGVVGTVHRSFDMRVDVEQPLDIGSVGLTWWDARAETERQSLAPALRLEPLPRDVDHLVSKRMADVVSTRRHSQWGIMILALFALALVVALIVRLFRTERHGKVVDRQLRRALAQDNSPIEALHALAAWAEMAFPVEPPVTLDQVGDRLGSGAKELITDLRKAAFGCTSQRVDARSQVLAIVEIAGQQRRELPSRKLAYLLDRVFGPAARLPDIEPGSR